MRRWIGWLAASMFWTAPANAADGASGEIDLLELHLGGTPEHLLLQSTWTLGAGEDQFVLKFDTSSDTRVGFDDAEVQALYARSLSGKITVLAGMRHDFRAGRDQGYATAGVEVNPLPWLEAEHYVYLASNGNLVGSWQLLANWQPVARLTVEPRVTGGWAAQAIPREDIGSGLTDVELSVRLRHPVASNANLYVGAIQERLLGKTRRAAQSAGDPGVINRVVIGAGFTF